MKNLILLSLLLVSNLSFATDSVINQVSIGDIQAGPDANGWSFNFSLPDRPPIGAGCAADMLTADQTHSEVLRLTQYTTLVSAKK